MGRDIYIFVERRRRNRWDSVDPPFRRHSFDSSAWHFDRCKDAFALLSGWRGADARIVSISEPRGLPKDLSKDIRQQITGGELHSFSWLSAEELFAADLDQLVKHKGVVDVESFRDFLRTGRPSSWCAFVIDPASRTVSNEEMRRVSEWWEPGRDRYYTELEWTLPLRETIDPLLQFMEHLKKEGDPKTIRIVFGFDQ